MPKYAVSFNIKVKGAKDGYNWNYYPSAATRPLAVSMARKLAKKNAGTGGKIRLRFVARTDGPAGTRLAKRKGRKIAR